MPALERHCCAPVRVVERAAALAAVGFICLVAFSHAAGQEPSAAVPAVSPAPAPIRAGSYVELLDGAVVSGEVAAVSPGLQVTLTGAAAPVPLGDVYRIVRSKGASTPSARVGISIRLAHRGVLHAKSLVLANDSCTAELILGGKATFPIDLLRGAAFVDSAQAAVSAALAGAPREQDRLFLVAEGDALQAIDGLIESVSASEVVFEHEGEAVHVPLARVAGIALAAAPAGELPPCDLELTDGSRLPGRMIELAEGKLTFALVGGEPFALTWESVSRATFRSDKLLFLSDAEPEKVVEATLFTAAAPWQRDASVTGAPLRLRGKSYDKGLGVHARSELTFACRGYAQFAAVIGIDDSAGEKGNCRFVVLGDGRELFSRRMTGRDAPHELLVDLGDAKTVSLLVEPGEDFDLADHADWCAARLLRP